MKSEKNIFIAFLLMSMGYAAITGVDLEIAGTAQATAQKGVFIYEEL